MTNATTLAQGSAAPGEAIVGRSRSAGRNGNADAEDGGFPNVLEKLAGGNRDRSGGEAGSPGEARPSNAEPRKIAGWLTGNVATFGGEAPAETGEGPFPDQLMDFDGPDRGAKGGDAVATALADACGSAGQGVAGDVAVAMASDAAALAARATTAATADAGDGAAVPQPGQPRGNAEPLSQGLAQLAALPKGVGRSSGRGAGNDTRVTVAEIAVLRRETHLAPARGAVVVDADPSPGRGGTRMLPANAHAGQDDGDTAVLPLGSASEHGAAAQPLAPHIAASAARATDRSATPQTAAAGEGASAGFEAAAQGGNAPLTEQAAPTVRADALPNAGQASGAVQQLAQRIAVEAGTVNAAPERAETPAHVQRSPFVPAVKVLHIELQPADLGTVTVRMSLRDRALQLDLEVGRGETAQLIQRERETLSTLLRSAGYLIDGLDVRLADQGGTGVSTGGNQPNMQMHGGQSGSPGADARSPGARPQDERRGNTFGNERNRDDDETGHAPRRGGIYV